MGLFNKKEKKNIEETANNTEKVSRDLTIEEINSDKKEKKQVKHVAVKSDTKDAYKVLVKPLITEKAAHLKVENKYLFQVYKNTTKNEIKKAIFHVYGVWPQDVNIINLKGKSVRYGKHSGTTKDKKKAIVTLKKGESIEVYEGV